MEKFDLSRRLAAEALGSAALLAVVIGSGIMAERLSGGNTAITLLGNTLPTGAILVVLIIVFGPLSGAHFNPAVTLAFLMRREIPPREALLYVIAQVAGGLAGALLAHAMFELPLMQVSETVRTGAAQCLSEWVATFGLVATILGALRFRSEAVPFAVGLYITAGYWFTASTSFANPAVTIARSFTNTFSGIAPSSAPAFIAAELFGAATATLVCAWLMRSSRPDQAATPETGCKPREQTGRAG
jgi:glycerol uptake facilitator-like aquaporin